MTATQLKLVPTNHAPLKHIELYAETNLPTTFGTFKVLVYREVNNPEKEHLAIIAGEVSDKSNVLLRVHSECFTAEVLGSMKCDCREQLHAALERIAEKGEGVVVYLRQEGRGIGLGNKIRAYALQEHGADTVDANRMLGFGDDLRTYEVAAEMIADLGIESIRLMTNNPLKIKGMQSHGVNVEGREPIFCPPNTHNLHYFSTKQERMGHMFDPQKLKLS